MSRGETIRYQFRTAAGMRLEGANLAAIKEEYPDAHITGRVVDNGEGIGHVMPYTGEQPYEAAAKRSAKEEEREEAALRAMTVAELKALAQARDLSIPDQPRKDDLIALLIWGEDGPGSANNGA